MPGISVAYIDKSEKYINAIANNYEWCMDRRGPHKNLSFYGHGTLHQSKYYISFVKHCWLVF